MKNEKACYSNVERMEQHDYIVGFSDAQTLQVIRRKLFKAIEAIDQALDTVSGINKHYNKTTPRKSRGDEGERDFDHLSYRYQNHRRCLVALVDFQQGAAELVSGERNFSFHNSAMLTML